MRYDVCVVGSGIAGMTAAGILAKDGRKVLVIERSARPGGLMRTFRRGGVVLPTGIHVVGSLGEGEILWRYFRFLGLTDRVRFLPLASGSALAFAFPGFRFELPRGRDAFRGRLREYFPGEGPAIERFVGDLAATVSQFALYSFDPGPERPAPPITKQSLTEYVDSLGCSPRLSAVLTAINPFHGVPPSECPVYVHFLVLDSFLNSAWRIDESRVTLAEAFESVLSGYGARTLCSALVTAVETREGRVCAVTVDGGERIETDAVVFTGHPRNLLALCRDTALRPAYRTRLTELEDTASFFGVSALCRCDGGPPQCGHSFVYRGLDTERQYSQDLLGTRELPNGVFSSAWPAGDAAWLLSVFAVSRAEEWSRWADTRTGTRPDDYRRAKADMSERIVRVAREGLGGSSWRVESLDSFSPLTLRDYMGTASCSAYGVKKSIAALPAGRIAAATRVKGLFLAGQSVILPGVVGTVISAVEACAAILGREYLMRRIAEVTG